MKEAVRTAGRIITDYKVFAALAVLLIAASLLRIPFGTFNDSSPIDSLSHLLLPALLAPIGFAAIVRYARLPRFNISTTVLLVGLLGVVAEILWEVMEFTVDSQFGTNWQVNNADTMYDIILAMIGAPIGAWIACHLRPEDVADQKPPLSLPR